MSLDTLSMGQGFRQNELQPTLLDCPLEALGSGLAVVRIPGTPAKQVVDQSIANHWIWFLWRNLIGPALFARPSIVTMW
jgi:hypothetical protein